MTKFNEQFKPFSQISGNSLEDYFNNFRFRLMWNYTHNFFFLTIYEFKKLSMAPVGSCPCSEFLLHGKLFIWYMLLMDKVLLWSHPNRETILVTSSYHYPWHQLAVVLAVIFCSMVNYLFGTCFIDSSNLNVNAFIEYGHLQLQVLFYSALCLLFIYDLKILAWNLNAYLTYSFHKSQSKFSTLISLLP